MSIRSVTDLEREKERGSDNLANQKKSRGENKIAGAKSKRAFAGEQSENRLGRLIKSQGSAFRRQSQTTFDEAGKTIARHGAGAGEGANVPGEAEDQPRAHGGGDAEDDAANGLRRSKDGPPVRK